MKKSHQLIIVIFILVLVYIGATQWWSDKKIIPSTNDKLTKKLINHQIPDPKTIIEIEEKEINRKIDQKDQNQPALKKIETLENNLAQEINNKLTLPILKTLENKVPIIKEGDLNSIKIMRIKLEESEDKLTVYYYLEPTPAYILKLKNPPAYEYLLNTIEAEMHKSLRKEFKTINHFSFKVFTNSP